MNFYPSGLGRTFLGAYGTLVSRVIYFLFQLYWGLSSLYLRGFFYLYSCFPFSSLCYFLLSSSLCYFFCCGLCYFLTWVSGWVYFFGFYYWSFFWYSGCSCSGLVGSTRPFWTSSLATNLFIRIWKVNKL